MQKPDTTKKVIKVFENLTKKYPQVSQNSGKILYYFCGSATALLYSTTANCQYLGFNNISVNKFEIPSVEKVFFDQPIRKFHDIDLVTTNTETKNEIPCFFVPSSNFWEKVFLPRLSFLNEEAITGIKLDNLYQWNGFFDVVAYKNNQMTNPLYLISPEALVAYKIFEICFGDKHMSDLKILWQSKNLNKERVKKFIKANLEFYAGMTEFNTILSLYSKYFTHKKQEMAISPFLDLFTTEEIQDILTRKIHDSFVLQKNIYTKIDKDFLDGFLSEMKR